MEPVTIYVIAVIFVATVVRSTLGFGEALIAVPLLALRLPMAVAAPLAVLVSVTVAAVIVAQDWRRIEIRSASWLIVSALFGIPLGLLLLTRVDDRIVKTILGALIVTFAIYSLAARNRHHLARDHRGWLLGFGFCSGVLGGAYGMNGPPLVVYGALRRWSPQHFRATLQGYFLVASTAGLAGYAGLGLWNRTLTRYYLLSLPAAVVGIGIGRLLNHRLKAHVFFPVVYGVLVAIGMVLLLQAVQSRT
jgi:uncharacterized protein